MKKKHCDYGSLMDMAGYGSLLDWIPLYEEPETYYQLYINRNANSPLRGRYAMSTVDDHGRWNYEMLPEDWKLSSLKTLTELAAEQNIATYVG
jgi:hypothetical protein